MSKMHKCFAKVNKELAKHNTVLDTNVLVPNQLFVSTLRLPFFRTSRKRVVAAYCPFCGEKLPV